MSKDIRNIYFKLYKKPVSGITAKHILFTYYILENSELFDKYKVKDND